MVEKINMPTIPSISSANAVSRAGHRNKKRDSAQQYHEDNEKNKQEKKTANENKKDARGWVHGGAIDILA